MNSKQVRMAMWSMAAATAVAAGIAWHQAIPRVASPSGRLPRTSPAPPRELDTTGLTDATGLLLRRNPFRIDHQPTLAKFDPWAPVTVGPPPAVPTPVARPVLSLIGLIGGPPWSAIVDGVPNRSGGVVLSQTDSGGAIRLLRVRGDTVTLAGFDTTYTLTYRRP